MNKTYRMFSILFFIVSLMGCCACSAHHTVDSTSDSSFATESSVPTQITSHLDESTNTISEKNELVYETVPHENAVITRVEDIYLYSAAEVEFGLGLSNPIITENILINYGALSGEDDSFLKECEKNSVLDQVDYLIPAKNASDSIGWYEIWSLTYESFIKESQRGEYAFDIDLVRYIMAENGLRFWIDEIPYSLFESMFPEYIELYNERATMIRNGEIDESKYTFVQIVCPETTFSHFVSVLHCSFQNAENTYVDDLSLDELKGLVFRQMLEYNSIRMRCLYASRKFACGQIEIGRTSDGKYVATPTVDQYKKLMKDIHSIPRCESIDILNVETRDDIIEADIDIERIGKIYARVTEDI